MKLFRNVEQDFGRVSAVSDRNVMLPDEWWLCYGSNAPNLQKLAIRVLSQTCSASSYERNWSIFEHIHSKKQNRLEHQRLNDLVYVHYNLRLQQRIYFKG
ncbi:U3 small nucleolar RNA-associated protein [Actinidia chinensis var. chinensis]|uniref:U3 small nucleolar RNA-associated protein n=1 Tax=Actinidia chinensis var. chinensis TaxID=1590841 RepID=A0A2R6QI31_ACTCC|nr:U3 small nucleolar RNA-associated protein [Actinidia chinensis var. chinensis]